jgi:RNA polymerase sigma factor (sigma-70 family)
MVEESSHGDGHSRAEGLRDPTSRHIRGAIRGNDTSLAWVVARFSPFLRAQAEYRLKAPLRRFLDPEDLVQDVWLVTLPRLVDLVPRNERFTPVLLKFLSTTLLRKVNDALTHHLAGPRRVASGEPSTAPGTRVNQLPASVTDALGRLQRDDTVRAMEEALCQLKPHEREVLILRGIEQVPNRRVARLLGLEPSTVAMRYCRALLALRRRMPDSLFDELPAEGEA